MYRDHTKVIKIGNRVIGGGNPILIQSMTNTKTEDVEATVAQILSLEKAGCDIIRCAVPTMEAVKALSQKDDWYAQLNAEYRERQKLAGEIFDLLGVRYDKHSGGMFLWGKIDDREESGEKLSDMILQKAHVFITPGFIFGSNGERYIRISLCAKQEVLREAAGRIRRVLHVSHFKHGSWC